MLSIIPLVFFGSVACIPIFSDMFNIGCTNPIHQVLDPVQGLRPDTQSTASFGYVYRLDTPTLRLGPDISIYHPSSLLPRQAASILSSIEYDEFNAKLVIRGSVSKLNAYRLQRVPSMEGTLMTIRFATFGAQDGQWYNQLGSSSGGITGKIDYVFVQEKGGQSELTIELSPEPNMYQNKEYLNYKTSRGASLKEIDWTGSGMNGCRTHKQVNSKRDRFHETFESAVLL